MDSKKPFKVKVGFVPAHREPFDEEWAVQMRERCLKAFSKVKDMELVVPNKITKNGLVRNDSDADRTIKLFDRSITNLWRRGLYSCCRFIFSP